MNKPKLVRPKVTKILYLTAFIIFLNILVSAYLLHIYYSLNAEAACSINETFDCVEVAKSHYSTLLGLPVALWGVGFYTLMFIGTLAVAFNFPFSKIKLRPGIVLNILRYLAYFGVLFALYLTYAELFVINVICPWCLVQQVLVIIITGLFVWINVVVQEGLKKTKVCEFC